MSNDNLPDFIKSLLEPAVYPHKVAEVRLVQTHISYVLLAGDYVYKIKKPVDFGFLDFTTIDKRRHFCEQELELNRRLCPEIYLEVVSINLDADGVVVLNGAGTPVDYAVKMTRMPEERMMGKIIDAGELTDEKVGEIVDILVPFYQRADGGAEIKEFGRSSAVAVNVLENFEQTEGFIGCPALSREQFDLVSGYARAFLDNEELFAERIDAGRIRDCHGDLYSANICLADKVYIFDCIEFNQRFRYCDVASDVAFLAMDLDYHGLEQMSEYFIDNFVERAGDSGLRAMLNFYKCYRAYVRGKIGLFTAHAPEVDEATKATCLEQASRYFKLAERYARGQ
jgi:hypothetical protein